MMQDISTSLRAELLAIAAVSLPYALGRLDERRRAKPKEDPLRMYFAAQCELKKSSTPSGALTRLKNTSNCVSGYDASFPSILYCENYILPTVRSSGTGCDLYAASHGTTTLYTAFERMCSVFAQTKTANTIYMCREWVRAVAKIFSLSRFGSRIRCCV